MPRIHYLTLDGQTLTVEADNGMSIMQAALMQGVPGILGDCGGACQCATCHVQVDEPWAARLGPVEEMEDAMLDCTTEPRAACSRLACTLVMSPELDGIVVRLPALA